MVFQRNFLTFSLLGPNFAPFAVAVFKNVMYWDDWNAQGIFMADKNRGTGLLTIASRLPGVMDLKVSIHQWRQRFRSHFTMFHFLLVFCRFFSQSLRHGTNACATNSSTPVCPFLCMGRPNNGHSCICPEGMYIELQANGSEKCLCPDAEDFAGHVQVIRVFLWARLSDWRGTDRWKVAISILCVISDHG